VKNANLDSILKKAIDNEEEARQFYLDIARIVTDKMAKDTLTYLASEEKKHKEYLLRYCQESFISNADKVDDETLCKIDEFLKASEVKPDMESKDVYLLAAAKELNSYNLYVGMASLHPEGEIKRMLLQMANEEMKHKEKVEYLYDNTAFVQTSGG
jgi:rubrerythrin